MDRTTLSLTPQLRDRLRRLAAERGVSMATIIREAVEEKLADVRPRPRSLGVGASGKRDIARSSTDLDLEPRAWR